MTKNRLRTIAAAAALAFTSTLLVGAVATAQPPAASTEALWCVRPQNRPECSNYYSTHPVKRVGGSLRSR